MVTHEHLRKDEEEARALGLSPNLPRAMLFKPPGLNSLSATLAHRSAWEQRLHAVAAAFGHGCVFRGVATLHAARADVVHARAPADMAHL